MSQSTSQQNTISDSRLHTWWHETGEINTRTRVENGSVRQSHKYFIQVALEEDPYWYDSFVYETIPRNGRGNIYSPWEHQNDINSQKDDDGISLEGRIGVTMAWSQFEYSEDVKVKIKRVSGQPLGSCKEVVIRPAVEASVLQLEDTNDGGIVIHVPKSEYGRRFSVEFPHDLYTYRSNGQTYVEDEGCIVGIEPKNALLIFASPFLPPEMTPRLDGSNVRTMKPGPINLGDWGSQPILYFPPGVYWMNSDAVGGAPRIGEMHMTLHPNTYWVHFAPGAYVKGAIEYSTKAAVFYATGHGVLSGEHYVYLANIGARYQGVKGNLLSLRMWCHRSTESRRQTWQCVGPTINAPPYHSMEFFDANGNSHPDVPVLISDYKQVGAFFFQTGGPQMYSGSIVSNVFYHVNDDGIKAYYSHVLLSRAVVWKANNNPIIQVGWSPRSVVNFHINNLYVVHSRYRRSEMYVPTALIGSSPCYDQNNAPVKPDLTKAISMTIENVMVEGLGMSLLRLTPLANYRNFVIRNISYDGGLIQDGSTWNQFGPIGCSVVLPSSPPVSMRLKIENWTVKGQRVNMDNFHHDRLGKFNIDASYWGQWSIR